LIYDFDFVFATHPAKVDMAIFFVIVDT